MSEPITKLTVFNMALAELEQEPIVDVSDTSFNASTLRTFYDTAFKTTLKAGSWDFATKYATLTLISEADNITRFQYLYQLPEDFLEFQWVYDTNKYESSIEYEKASDGLRTNSNPTYLRYTWLNENYADFDADFCSALAYKLAELSSSRILGSLNKKDYLEGRAGREQAIALNKGLGKGGKSYTIKSTWVNTHVQNN